MKAFVIKLKENRYWLGGFYGKNNYNDIAHAKVYHLRTQADKQCKLINETYNYNAQVVEITIAEGDLEQQLAEKDKEIEQLKKNIEFDTAYYIKELVNVRKQVCDMTRKKIVESTCYDTEEEIRNVIYDLNASTVLEILDQIEKGE